MSQATQLKDEVRRLRCELELLRKENELLRQKVDALSRRIFGKKSEQLDPAQLELLMGMIDSQAQTQEKGQEQVQEQPQKPCPKRRDRKRRIRTPEDLEVVEELLVPEQVRANRDVSSSA